MKKVKRWIGMVEYNCSYSCFLLSKDYGKDLCYRFGKATIGICFCRCFVFCAGVPDREILINKPQGFTIIAPQNEEWERLRSFLSSIRRLFMRFFPPSVVIGFNMMSPDICI